jgi:hypothetical protein
MAVDDLRSGTWVTYIGGKASSVRVRRCRIEITAGPDSGLVRDIEAPVIRIGARRGNDVQISDSKVSGLHAEIRLDDRGYRLRDLDSTNGTFVGGLRVNDIYIPPGTQITVGGTRMRFEPLGESVEVELADSDRFGSMIGRSIKMRELFARLAKLARADATVLITGETRHRQGAGSGGAARAVAARQGAVRGARLRLDPAQPDRERAVRPRARRVHRRHRELPRRVRAGPRRHGVPRRDRRAAAGHAAQAAARAGGQGGPAGRRPEGHRRRHPGGRGHQPRPRGRGQPRALPRGPVLPAGGGARARAAAARPPRGHPAAHRPHPGAHAGWRGGRDRAGDDRPHDEARLAGQRARAAQRDRARRAAGGRASRRGLAAPGAAAGRAAQRAVAHRHAVADRVARGRRHGGPDRRVGTVQGGQGRPDRRVRAPLHRPLAGPARRQHLGGGARGRHRSHVDPQDAAPAWGSAGPAAATVETTTRSARPGCHARGALAGAARSSRSFIPRRRRRRPSRSRLPAGR